VHFDPEVAYNYHIVREDTDRTWQESMDNRDEGIATAAAGAILFILYGSDASEGFAISPSKAFDLD
jgi:hypothetical protein